MAQQTVQVLNNYIDGQWVEAATEHSETVYNPASGEEMARVPLSSRVDVDRAVAAAKAAFAGWSKTPCRAEHGSCSNISSCWWSIGMNWRRRSRWRMEKLQRGLRRGAARH